MWFLLLSACCLGDFLTPAPTLLMAPPAIRAPAGDVRRMEAYYTPSGHEVPGGLVESCDEGTDVRGRWPGAWMIWQVDPDGIRRVGHDGVLTPMSRGIVDEADRKGMLLVQLYEDASALVDARKAALALTQNPCWPEDWRALVQVHPEVDSYTVVQVLYTLGQAQMGGIDFAVDDPAALAAAVDMPPRPALVEGGGSCPDQATLQLRDDGALDLYYLPRGARQAPKERSISADGGKWDLDEASRVIGDLRGDRPVEVIATVPDRTSWPRLLTVVGTLDRELDTEVALAWGPDGQAPPVATTATGPSDGPRVEKALDDPIAVVPIHLPTVGGPCGVPLLGKDVASSTSIDDALARSPAILELLEPEPQGVDIFEPRPEADTEVELIGSSGNEEEAWRTVRRYQGQLQYCYEAWQARDDVPSPFTVEISAAVESGRATSVESSPEADVTRCMVKKVQRWRFPDDVESVAFTATFTLEDP